MQFELLTLAGTRFSGEVVEVSLATLDGQLSILPHHEDLTSVVATGPVTVRPRAGKTETFVAYGGLLEVTAAGVKLLVDEADHIDDLVEDQINAALAEAKRLRESATSDRQLAHATRMVERQTARLEIAHRHHHRRV